MAAAKRANADRLSNLALRYGLVVISNFVGVDCMTNDNEIVMWSGQCSDGACEWSPHVSAEICCLPECQHSLCRTHVMCTGLPEKQW